MTVIATRRERVIVEAVDQFSTPMARMAASAALFDKSLNKINGSTGLQALGRNSDSIGRSINQLTGRIRLFADAAAVLGPALVPIGAAAVPALAGMATQLGLTVAAAGTAALAFSGVGDALKSLNDYQLEPTADNLRAMQTAMENLGPAGADFVRFLDQIAPQFEQLQMTARAGMFPGIEEGITSLLGLLPKVNAIVGELSAGMGQLASEAGAGLSGEGFRAFFDYLENNARPILVEMGQTIGNFAEGLANMVVDFSPLTADFSGGLLEMSEAFSEWSDNLSDNQSFQEFLSYVQESGPMVLDLIGSVADAFVQIAQAAAPIGAIVVPALTKLFEVIAKIADSPLGTMFIAAAAGLAVYNRAAALAVTQTSKLAVTQGQMVGPLNTSARALKVGGAAVGIMALSMTDLDEKAGLSNTAMLAMAGTMAGPWGAAAGAAAGFTMDLAAANDSLTAAIERGNRAFEGDNTAEQRDAMKALRDEIDKTTDAQAGVIVAFGQGDFSGAADGFVEGAKTGFLRLTGQIDAAKDALAGFRSQAQSGQDLGALLAGPLGLTADAFEAATQSAEEFTAAVAKAMGILDKRSALRAARDAVRDFNDQLADAPNKLRPGTAAYDKMEAALDNIGKTSLTAAEGLRGMARVNFLDKQRDQFLAAAKAMDIPIGRAKLLADRLGLLDKTKANPKVDADTAAAEKRLGEVEAQIAAINKANAKPKVTADAGGFFSIFTSVISALNSLDGKTATTYIRTVHTGGGGGGPQEFNGASGGYTGRGGKYEYAGIVHKGELVLPQEVVNRDWSMLKSRYSGLPGFADGGLVGGAHTRGADVGGVGELGRSAHNAANELDRERDGRRRNAEQQERLVDRLKSQVDSIKSAVAGVYQQDIFSSGSELTGLGFSSGQLMAQQQQVRDQALSANIRDQREAIRLLRELRRHGLDGPAYVDLAATGDLEALRAYAGLSKRDLRHFEKRFELSQSLGSRLEGVASRDVQKHYVAELRELRQINAHLRQNQRDNKKNSDDNAEKVADGVNRAMVAGSKGRAR